MDKITGRDRAVSGGRSRSLSGTNLCSVLNRCGVRPSQIRGGTQIARPWPSLCPRRLCGSFRTVTVSEGDQPQRHRERGDGRSEMGDRRWEIGDRLPELTLLMTLRPNWRTRPSMAPSMSECNSCQSSVAYVSACSRPGAVSVAQASHPQLAHGPAHTPEDATAQPGGIVRLTA